MNLLEGNTSVAFSEPSHSINVSYQLTALRFSPGKDEQDLFSGPPFTHCS